MKKKLISLMLVLALAVGVCPVAFAALMNTTTLDVVESPSPLLYDAYTISFSDEDDQIATYGAEHRSKIDRAIDFVKSLDLSDRGFYGIEDVYINELNALAADGVELKSYSVYMPRDGVNYGSYDGYQFRATYSVYDESYTRTLSDKNNFDKWVDGGINILMSCIKVNKTIAIPYTAISALAGISGAGVEYFNKAKVDITVSDEVTSRFIWIEDKDHLIAYQPGTYVPVINDMARITRPVFVLYPNSPFQNPTVNANYPLQEFASANFYNASKNREIGFYRYINGNVTDYLSDTVGQGTYNWG